MKLATYSTAADPTPRIGVVLDDQMVDLASCGAFPTDMKTLLAQGIDVAAIEAVLGKGGRTPLTETTLMAPVTSPGKILAIGLNYADHIEETGADTPKHQIWFNKQHNCANGPYADINLPKVSDKLDYEAELCLVIGKRCKHVPRERAHEVIGGYFCGNDVSVRDWQIRVPTFQIGKSFDTHGPFGPWLVTADEVPDPHDLHVRALVNGEVRQDFRTDKMVFDCFRQIEIL